MLVHRLPEIDRGYSGSSEDIKEEPRRGRSYQRAVSELKQVRRKVSITRNRLNFLLFKQEEAQSPLAAYYQQNHSRLRVLAEHSNQCLKEQLSAKKLRAQSEVELKRRTNQIDKRERMERIYQAKRMVTAQKLRVHEEVRQTSRENLRAIQSFRHQFLQQKQTQRQLLYTQQRKQAEAVREQHQRKVRVIRQQTEEDTKRIYQKIEQKERELRAIEEQCKQFQQIQHDRAARQRQRKVMKLKHRRLATLQIQDRSTTDAYKPPASPSTSPHSCMSFVIIS